MSAIKIKCSRCLTKSGAIRQDGTPIEFYIEEDGRIHCEACVDGEVEVDEARRSTTDGATPKPGEGE